MEAVLTDPVVLPHASLQATKTVARPLPVHDHHIHEHGLYCTCVKPLYNFWFKTPGLTKSPVT
jgi:hypothetical protein